ncbi:prepilin peptidase [Campylobacter sp. MIT 21-1685]|uniref:prepilin peptidase n=1 Tax=unclassified Campylobacter TaxID=2593542 RepID=UPI00224A94FF|nr:MULTISPECIES: A24 family peptidase [unclassified Campylobacter]MCX2682774.1 prepilin peptidase [Campylobacter sp. MIT 21-1684]MCX2751080.1 prepilin peptidase [Campylobacter sp. MIT 21-1682]MCX2807255.1 prepilin peptidase [Campylobacter sp. MIT 21-1685]
MASEFLKENFFIFSILLTVFGLCLGSFCVSFASRICNNKALFSQRSFCFVCGKTLQIYELIPFFSYLFLKAKCRHCGSTIPFFNFLGEVFGGVLVWFAFLAFWLDCIEFSIWNFIFFLFFLFALFLLSLIDWQLKAVPQFLLWTVFFFALCLAFDTDEFAYFFLFENCNGGFFSNAFFFAGFVFLLKNSVAFVKNINTKHIQENLGDADIIVLASFAGLLGIKSAFVIFVLAGIFSLPFFLWKNEKELAFLPFLSFAFLVYLFFPYKDIL